MQERERRLGLKDLFYFNKYILGFKDFQEKLHGDLCNFTTQKSKNRRKLILLPRGSFKSTAITIGQSLWEIVKNPNIRILIDSEKHSNSSKFLSAVKGIIETSEKFKGIYGSLDGSKKGHTWSQFEATVSTRTEMNLKEPTLSTAGVDVVKVGMHYDLIIIDDPVSENNTTTPEQIQKVINHYRFLLSILEPTGRLIIIGTRWDYGDLYGYILEDENKIFDIMVKQAVSENEETGKKEYLFPERLTPAFLKEMKKSQGSYIWNCNPGYAPILMADGLQKKIKDVKVGDEIMGFSANDGKRRRIVKTKVLEVNSRTAETKQITFENGKHIRCTPEHNWFTGRYDETHRLYKPAKVKSSLLKVYNIENNVKDDVSKLLDYQYLAGMLDGEGACKYGSISISQSDRHNPKVVKKIREVLKRLKLPFRESIDERKQGILFVIKGGRDIKFKILRLAKPAKSFQILNTIFDNASRLVISKDKVKSIDKPKREKVYALTTETGNYIVWGYCSKNCQYQNNPIDKDNAVFKKSWFRYYEGEVKNKCLLIGDKTIPINIFTMIDPALSKKEGADFSAIVTVGLDIDNNLYVLDYVNEHLSPYELDDAIFAAYDKWKPISVGIEAHANQSYFLFTLPEEQKRRGKWFRIEELKPYGDKESRIRRLQPMFESGSIYLKRDMHILEDQLLRFPFSRHDDLMDALAYAPDLCYPKIKKRDNKKVYRPTSNITGY